MPAARQDRRGLHQDADPADDQEERGRSQTDPQADPVAARRAREP